MGHPLRYVPASKRLCLVRRRSNLNAYSREYLSIYIEENERMSILTSHLIIGYEGFSLISELLCKGRCSIKSTMKYLSNPNEKLEKKNLFSFLKSLSLFSCFYGIYPGEYTQIYLLNMYLINLY